MTSGHEYFQKRRGRAPDCLAFMRGPAAAREASEQRSWADGGQRRMSPQRKRCVVSRNMSGAAAVVVSWLVTLASGARAQEAVGDVQTATNPARYQVNYRATANDPWQLYASTRSLEKANTIAADVKSSGYLADVVTNLTPVAQPLPDYAATSALRYYPTSNWSSDYNYYVVPGGNYNNYGWYGGWNPWYGYRSYPNYWWNGGSSYYGAGWGGHYWGGGWRRGGGWGVLDGAAAIGRVIIATGTTVTASGRRTGASRAAGRAFAPPEPCGTAFGGTSSARASRRGAACEPRVGRSSRGRTSW